MYNLKCVTLLIFNGNYSLIIVYENQSSQIFIWWYKKKKNENWINGTILQTEIIFKNHKHIKKNVTETER